MSFLTPEDLDPELIKGVAANATNADKQRALELQLTLAGHLRNRATDHGTMAGNIYIPPNPVTGALDTIDRLQGLSDSIHGQQKQADLISQRGNALSDFFDKYFNKKKDAGTTPLPDVDAVTGREYPQ